MDFNSNDFLGLTTKQTAQLQKMIQSGEAGTIVKKGANGAPVVDFSSGTLKETEGKKFDSNSFDFFAEKEIVIKDEKDNSIADLASKFFGMFKSSSEETEKIG